jgi:DNA topoisomerase III
MTVRLVETIQSSQSPLPLRAPSDSALSNTLERIFGFSHFRSSQEEICTTAMRGQDVLVVMPTGAGKSLCYQLPAVAKPHNRTIVVTPLIALMDDQESKLKSFGISTAAIHSGKSRLDCRQSCIDWRDGRLQVMFISPERLGVQEFFEFLVRYKPDLIAIDEAHCISCWGHDFRPDYRMLGEKIAALRPANVIALTATATTEVQQDILQQLGMTTAAVFVEGFRRTNLAIDVLNISNAMRVSAIQELLRDEHNRPAIVYAPTRAAAELLAKNLSSSFKVGLYHAGRTPAERFAVQDQFLSNQTDVMVATIAFGMGIDKPNIRTVIHAALPSSIEGYYQEIGRAGRDGKPSRAVLMYANSDIKTHEWFFESSYPNPDDLEFFHASLPQSGAMTDDLQGLFAKIFGSSKANLQNALEKLWIHAAIQLQQDGLIQPVKNRSWLTSYRRQFFHRKQQLQAMLAFAGKNQCRMVQIVRHFGDKRDEMKACELCDACQGSIASHHNTKNEPTLTQINQHMRVILKALQPVSAKPAGPIFQDVLNHINLTRREFEVALNDLVDLNFVRTWNDQFIKDGQEISYRWLSLTETARQWLYKHKLAPAPGLQIKTTPKKRKRKKK